ncbi:MAG TPA: NUDIX domain-containing protein [Anaerolineales bacterium]|nr:NUDIX domain-containing protein [Anaerolineales bacterium]
MKTIIVGKRVGKNGRLGVGCSASIFDSEREKVLLIRRADNGKWAVPGGYMEAGENFSEACKREVWEETGLEVHIKRLIGIYTSPNLLLEYPDGNKWQLVVLHFEAEVVRGELRLGDETTEFGYFSRSEANSLDMNSLDRKRVLDGFAKAHNAIINDDFVI